MRVLFLTHRVPYAPNRGDRVRALHLIRTLARHVDLEVVSLAHDPSELEQVDAVRKMGVRASAALVPRVRNHARAALRLIGSQPLTHLLLDAPKMRPLLHEIVEERAPDVVFAYCSGMARFALEPPLDRFPLVFDMVDVDSGKWNVLSQDPAMSPLKRWIYEREARTLGAFEAHAAVAARAVLVVNERERLTLQAIAPKATITAIPNGVDRPAKYAGVRLGAVPAVAFCGVMSYAPNVHAVLWFAREVWPRVRTVRLDAKFVVIGSDPTSEIRRLASESLGIEVTGAVPEVQSHLANCSVAVAPLKVARGIQNKVLEALGVGLPGVVTTAVAEGLPRDVLPACRIADDAHAFANQTLQLLALNDEERHALVSMARLETLTWERQLAPVVEILEEAAGLSVRPAFEVEPTGLSARPTF